jgi:hypothetical protein
LNPLALSIQKLTPVTLRACADNLVEEILIEQSLLIPMTAAVRPSTRGAPERSQFWIAFLERLCVAKRQGFPSRLKVVVVDRRSHASEEC